MARVVQVAPIELTLPPSVAVAEGSGDALVVAVDARSSAELRTFVEPLAAGTDVVVVAPISREGGRAWIGWAVSLARRVRALPLEDVCDPLRQAGVVDVRVLDVTGSLGLAVVSGRVSPR